MIARILTLVFLAVPLQSVPAADLDKLPSINETKRPADIELKGRELEAIDVAFRQFRQDHFPCQATSSISLPRSHESLVNSKSISFPIWTRATASRGPATVQHAYSLRCLIAHIEDRRISL